MNFEIPFCPRCQGSNRKPRLGGVLPPRDEELARTGQWLTALLASIDVPGHRRLVHAFATWHVMRRLRRTAGASRRPRTCTAHARNTIKAAAGFLSWLSGRGITLPGCRQPGVEDWLATSPGAGYVREFLTWAARHGHARTSMSPARSGAPGPRSPATSAGTWLEHPGFGGDSILPRCSGLGGRCLPRYRRLAEPRSDHFSAFCLIGHLSSCAVQLPA